MNDPDKFVPDEIRRAYLENQNTCEATKCSPINIKIPNLGSASGCFNESGMSDESNQKKSSSTSSTSGTTKCSSINFKVQSVGSPSGFINESRISNESEKKKSSSASRNKPPELVPYCIDIDDCNRDDDSSSPPRLFPEGIMTRTKMNRTLPEKSNIPAIDFTSNSSKPQTAAMQYIDIGDSSDEDSKKCVSYKEKKRDRSYIFDPFSLKQGKWRDFIIDRKELRKPFTNKHKPKLKEREKLKKASERMLSPPRAFLHSKDLNIKYKMENSVKKQPAVEEKKDDSFVVLVKDGQVTVTPCNKKLNRQQSNSILKKHLPSTSVKQNILPTTKPLPFRRFTSLPLSSPKKRNSFSTITTSSPVSVDAVSSTKTLSSFKGYSPVRTSSVKQNNCSAVTASSNKEKTFSPFTASPAFRTNTFSTNSVHNIKNEEDIVHITRSPVRSTKTFKAVDVAINKKSENIKNVNIHKINNTCDYVDINRETEFRKIEIHKTGNFNNIPGLIITPKEEILSENNITVESGNTKSLFSSSVSKMKSMDSNISKFQGNAASKTFSLLEGKRPKQTRRLIISSDDMSIDIKPINERPYNPKVFETETNGSQGNIKCNNKIVFTFPKCTTVTDSSGKEVSTIDIIEEKGDREYRNYNKRIRRNEHSLNSVAEEFPPLDSVVKLKEGKHNQNIVREHIKLEPSVTDELDMQMSSVPITSIKKTNENIVNRVKSSAAIEYDNTQIIKHHLSPEKSDKFDNVNINKLDLGSKIKKEPTDDTDITAGSSCTFLSNHLEDIYVESNVKLESGNDANQDMKKNKTYTRFDKDMFVNQDKGQGLFSVNVPNDISCETLSHMNWPDLEEDEDDDDEYFTLPQRVSTGKEERDVIEGIEFLSFETERDMVEFTKIQQDFWHGSSLDDGLDLMDDAFAVSGDMDMQYVHQAIVPTKTNDITKIKGWRNKQFAVNDNPSSYCGLNNESYEDDDGFESCDIKIADETNLEEQQQSCWYSEDPNTNEAIHTSHYDDGREEQEESKLSSCSDFEKPKSSPVKDDVMLSSGAVFKPETSELMKHLQTNVCVTKNTKSAFVSDILDNYLSSHSQLNISYEIPKLGAEEGITHHKELEVNQFPFLSPPKPSQTTQERSQVPKKVGPKAKTLAEKRKLLEQDFNQKQKMKIARTKSKSQTSSESDKPEERVSEPTENKEKKSSNLKPKSVPTSALFIEKRKKKLNLDPDYKYTWVRGRPIRITGSKIFRDPIPFEDNSRFKGTETGTLISSIQEHNLENVSETVKISSETISDKVKDKKYEQREATLCKESLPVHPILKHALQKPETVKTRTIGIVVSPCVGYPLHPLAIKHLKHLRSNKYVVDNIWAKFAVSVVTSQKEISNHVPEKHIIPINYAFPSQNENYETRSSGNTLKSHFESSNKSKSSLSKSAEVLEIPKDEVQLEAKKVLEDMVECVINHEIQDTVMKDDPDALLDICKNIPKSPKKIKKRKNRVYRELNRLDVNVIVMGEDGSGFIKYQDGENSCGQEFCRLGCVCSSIQNCEPLSSFSNHCGKAQCMFECSCKSKESLKINSENEDDSSTVEKPSLLLSTAMRLQDEGNRHLAKVEKEFRQTVIQSKNQMIVVGGSSSGDGVRRKREIKLPERYRDSSVVLGKEFAIAEFKMITGDDLYSSPNVPSSLNTKRTERQLNLPNYVQVDVHTLPPPKTTCRLTKGGRLTLEQKISLWLERYKITPCRVRVERMKGLEGVVPWCMVHLKYDCFCSGQSVKPFKKMPYRPLERPPPIPGPPLDCIIKRISRTRKRNSRNVAVKSTTHLPNIHAHDVCRHSARTYGTTINYRIRNQSHCFNYKSKIHSAHIEEESTSSDKSQTFVNCALAGNIIPAYVLQTLPVEASNEPQKNTSDDSEEISFVKIVSITSLKPEEFEKCEVENESMEQDDQNGQLQGEYDEIDNTAGMESVNKETSTDIDTLIPSKDSTTIVSEDQEVNLENSSQIHKVSVKLIPLLPEGCGDDYAVHLQELISKRETDLKNMCMNEEALIHLSGEAAGSLQVIKWNYLLNQLKTENIFLWLLYKGDSAPKFLLTESLNKPNECCVGINADKGDYKRDFHDEMLPSITFILDQLCENKRIPLTDLVSKENTFGLLHFNGDHWELKGSFLKEYEQCTGNVQGSENLVSNIPEEPDRNLKHLEGEINKNLSLSEENEIVSKHTLCEVMDGSNEVPETETLLENSVNVSEEVRSNLVDQSAEVIENLNDEYSSKHIQNNNDVDAMSSPEPIMNESTLNEDIEMIESSEKSFLPDSIAECSTNRKDEVDFVEKGNLNITPIEVKSKGESEIFSNESTKIISVNIQNNISKFESLLNSKDSEKDIGNNENIVLSMKLNLSENTDPVANDSPEVAVIQNNCSHNITEVPTKEGNDNQYENSNLVSKEIKDKSGVTTSSVLCMTVTLPPHSETPSDKSTLGFENDITCIDSELDSIQSNDILLENENTVTEKVQNETEIITESALGMKVTFSQNSETSQSKSTQLNEAKVQTDHVQNEKHESILKINGNKDENAEVDTVKMKAKSNDTAGSSVIQNNLPIDGIEVPLPTGMMPARWFMLIIKYKFDLLFVANSLVRYAQIVRAVLLANNHGKTVRLPLDNPTKELHENRPKFGVYAVPNLFTRVFIGPYGLREEAGVSAIKVIDGKLVNVMYKELEDVDEKIGALIGSGKEAVLNKKMEEMCDKNAQTLSNNKKCRGMWLCSSLKDKKRITLNSSDVQCVIPGANHSDNTSQDEVANKKNDNKSEKMEESVESDISKTLVENVSAQENNAEMKKLGSRRKQTFSLRDDNMVNDGAEKDMDSVSSVNTIGMRKRDITIIKDTSDSEDELLDVETPCNTGILFRESQLKSLNVQMQRKVEASSSSEPYYTPGFQPQLLGQMAAAPINGVCLVDKEAHSNPIGHLEQLPQEESVTDKAGITGSGQPVLSIGKTAVSIKLVPTIPSVGYVTAAMYHNKTILLNNPFSSKSQPCFFQNVDTAVRWLTDELKSKLEFVPNDLEFRWKIKHSTVKLKDCNPLDLSILDGQHILTEKGVAAKFKGRTDVHATHERQRRKELLECFRKLGQSFLTKKQLQKTNKFSILKLAYKEIKKAEQTSTKLLAQLASLRKKRINNFAKFCWKVKAIPSLEERKIEINKLIQIFGKETDQKPVFDVENMTRDAVIDELKSSIKPEENTPDTGNSQDSNTYEDDIVCEESASSDYLSDEKSNGDGNVKTSSEDGQIKSKPNDDKEKTEAILPLRLKNDKDESVSMSIFVVNGDDPLPVKSQPDKDVVTVTRIPQNCTCGNKKCIGSSCIRKNITNKNDSKCNNNSNNDNVGNKSTNIKSNKNESSLTRSSSISDMHSFVKKRASLLLTNRRSSVPNILSKNESNQKDNLNSQKIDPTECGENMRDVSSILQSPPRNSQGFTNLSNVYKSSEEEETKQKESSEESETTTLCETTGICYSLSGSQRRSLSISVDNDEIRTFTCSVKTPVTVSENTSGIRMSTCSLPTPTTVSQSSNGIKTASYSLLTPGNVSQNISGIRPSTSNMVTPISLSQSLNGLYTSPSKLVTPISVSQSLSGVRTSPSSLLVPFSVSQSFSGVRTASSSLLAPSSVSQSTNGVKTCASSLVAPVSVSQSISGVRTSSTSSLLISNSAAQSSCGVKTSTPSIVSQSLSGVKTSVSNLLSPIVVSQSSSGMKTMTPITLLKTKSGLKTMLPVTASSRGTKTTTSSTVTPVTTKAKSGLLDKFEFKRKLVGPGADSESPPKIRLVQKMTSDGRTTLVPTLVTYGATPSGKLIGNTAKSTCNSITDKNGDVKYVVYSNGTTNSTTLITNSVTQTTNSTTLPVISSQQVQPGSKLGYHLLTNNRAVKPVMTLGNIGQIRTAPQTEKSSIVKLLASSGNVQVPVTVQPGVGTSSQQISQDNSSAPVTSLKSGIIRANQMVQLQTLPGKTLHVAGSKLLSIQGNKKAQYVICNGKPILLHNSVPLVLSSQSTTVKGNVPVTKPSQTSDLASAGGENLTGKHPDFASNISSPLKSSFSTQITDSVSSLGVDGEVVKKPNIFTHSPDGDLNKLVLSPNVFPKLFFTTNVVTKNSGNDASQTSGDSVIKADKISIEHSVPESLHSHSVFSVTDSSSSSKTTLDIPIDSLSVVFSDNESVSDDDQTLEARLAAIRNDSKASKGSKLLASTSRDKCSLKKSVNSTQNQDSSKKSNKLKSKKLALKKKSKSKVVSYKPTRMVTRSKSRKKYQ